MDKVAMAGRSVKRMPFLALGFRPFYLLAALFAVGAMVLWIAALAGVVHAPDGTNLVDLHIHEFLFGFGSAVLAGFLLTAARSWSGRPTAHGSGLALLVALWLAGRVGMAASTQPAAALIDALFLPGLALVIAIPITRSGRLTHLRVVGLVGMLALANIGFHLQSQGWLDIDCLTPALAAIAVWILLIALVGGRVVPGFLDNARGVPLARRPAALEAAVFATTAAGFAAVLAKQPAMSAPLLAVAAAVHAVRLVLWWPARGRDEPLLWVLPLAYLWIPVGLGLLALAAYEVVPIAAAIHALTIGAMATMMLAMMTRSALGHTGRPLRAAKLDAAIFGFITAAALTRVLASLVENGDLLTNIAGAAWIAAFGLYAARYAPMLIAARADDKATGA